MSVKLRTGQNTALGIGLAVAGVLAAAGLAMGPAHVARADDKAASSSPRECFYSHNINGFNAPDEQTLYIRVGVKDYYRLDLTTGCTGLSFRESIGLKTTPPGDNFICDPIQAEVVFNDHRIPAECQVTAIHKLTDAEFAALPKKERP